MDPHPDTPCAYCARTDCPDRWLHRRWLAGNEDERRRKAAEVEWTRRVSS